MRNAFKELFTKRLTFKEEEFNESLLSSIKENYDIERVIDDGDSIDIIAIPSVETIGLSQILWAEVYYYYYADPEGEKSAQLKVKRTREEELEFLNILKTINYDDGYGTQQLYGTIVYKDSSWQTRAEYDGSEWWEHHSTPKTPDWAKE